MNHEISAKLTRVRELLRERKLDGVRFTSVAWFAWATAGGDSSVIFTDEKGVAEILITRTRAFVLTNAIEAERLAAEQIPPEYELAQFPWQEPERPAAFAASEAPSFVVDPDEPEWRALRWELSGFEVGRYRGIGHDAARAVSRALQGAHPEQSERELAGEAASQLWAAGFHPVLTLVAGESRVDRYRHPTPTAAPLGEKLMLVVCARKFGLYANLTRFLYFRPPTSLELARTHAVEEVEAEALRATRERSPLSEIYERIARRYRELGFADEIHRHHQGGPTGYLSREEIARPGAPPASFAPSAAAAVAYAWNPSLPGAKIEDTVLRSPDGALEILTEDPAWPALPRHGLRRPEVLTRL